MAFYFGSDKADPRRRHTRPWLGLVKLLLCRSVEIRALFPPAMKLGFSPGCKTRSEGARATFGQV